MLVLREYSCLIGQHKTLLHKAGLTSAIVSSSCSVHSLRSVPAVSIVKRRIISNKVVQSHSGQIHPSKSGDHFFTYSSDAKEADVKMEQQHDQLKGEVRKMLMEADKPLQKLNLIDAIQRLGVAYHFETEIEADLKHIYEAYQQHDHKYANDKDLYTVGLFFRLLRQEGYPISCDVFNKFMDKEENIQKSLSDDIRGMLSLYEASHLRVQGEDILDEALDFSATYLRAAIPNLSKSPIAAQVVHALDQPIHKSLTRLQSRHYITFFEQDDSHDKVLMDFAKMDFNLLQKLHQREFSEIKMWWKELDFARKLPSARDQVVEGCFWSLGVFFEPQFSFSRKALSQWFTMFRIIDDFYESNACWEDLVLFTDTIQRWEISASDQLPDYMKPCCQALFAFCTMIEEVTTKEGRSYCIDYARSAIKDVTRAFLEEARWSHEGYVPTMEEYMRVSRVTSSFRLLIILSFVGMGELATKEAFDWVSGDPLMVEAVEAISRLVDDMADDKLGQDGENVVSAVKCYMKQHGATKEQALVELQESVTRAWKDMNSECLHTTAIPMPLLVRVLNFGRIMHTFYKDEDTWDHSGTMIKDIIPLLLIDSLPVN